MTNIPRIPAGLLQKIKRIMGSDRLVRDHEKAESLG